MASIIGKRYGPVAEFCAVYGFGPWQCPDSETAAGLNAAIGTARAHKSMIAAHGHAAAEHPESALRLAASAGAPTSDLIRLKMAAMTAKEASA